MLKPSKFSTAKDRKVKLDVRLEYFVNFRSDDISAVVAVVVVVNYKHLKLQEYNHA